MNPNESSANKRINITTNGTTVLPVPSNPSRKFVLIRIVINAKGASSNTATIYDSNETIGANNEQLIGKIDTTANIATLEYGLPLYNGIYIVTATGTAPDLTVVYAETP